MVDQIAQEVEARLEEYRTQVRNEVISQKRQALASRLGNVDNDRQGLIDRHAQETNELMNRQESERAEFEASVEQANQEVAELDSLTQVNSTEDEVIG